MLFCLLKSNFTFLNFEIILHELVHLATQGSTQSVRTAISSMKDIHEYMLDTGIIKKVGNNNIFETNEKSEGLKPKDADKNEGHKVMRFNVLQASVRAYQRNLNTHSTYKGFREERAKLRDEGKPLDSVRLSKFLNKYAETGNQYVEVLQKIIKQNNLQDFDDAKLLPSSIELESLI